MFSQKNKYIIYFKSILPFLGIVVLLILNAIAYLQNFLFLDKLIVCSLILFLVFLIKLMSDNIVSYKD